MRREIADDALKLRTSRSSIKVHSKGGGALKELGNLLLHFFSACTYIDEFVFFAGGAFFGNACGVAAIVASEGARLLVESQSHIAMRASWHPSASLALDEGREASSVLEKDDLFLPFKGCPHHLYETGREESLHQTFAFRLFGVNHLNGRELHVTITLRELHVSVAVFACPMVHFERRGGCAHQGFRLEHVCQHDGSISCVIARSRFLLLVTLLMLFIHNDESEILEGQEDAGAYTENELIRLIRRLALIDFQSLRISEF